VFKIVGMEAREFPQFPEFRAEQLLTVPAGALREMIERTLFAVSTDETRYSLNGVYIEETGGGNVRMVSTDGHRLAFEERALGALGLVKGVILPRKGLGELKKLVESGDDDVVSIGFRENMGLVTKGKADLFMRLIDGDFPDYTKVIPTDNPTTVLIDHDQLLQALRRVSILSNERYKGVKMDFTKERVAISANNPDLGEAVEEIEADYNGKPMSIGFNARYMIEALSVLLGEGEIKIELKDELSPSVIRKMGHDNYLYVLMPMRL
ncbi:MAG: DNA polymerase III subunit beta, partial [Deltaproteobacteria bacterium]|nr:DNA polymerase III subunit beta [Deltaproteobacteria bacterium]